MPVYVNKVVSVDAGECGLERTTVSKYLSTTSSVPYDSFLGLQFTRAGIDPWEILKKGARSKGVTTTEVLATATHISQAQLSIAAIKKLERRLTQPPTMVVGVHHFNNEDWFNFVNGQLLKTLEVKGKAFCVVGLGHLGIPVAIKNIISYLDSQGEDTSAVLVACDRVVAPMSRLIPGYGILSDGAVAVELKKTSTFEDAWEIKGVQQMISPRCRSWFESCNAKSENSRNKAQTPHNMNWESQEVDFGKSEIGRLASSGRSAGGVRELIFEDAFLGRMTIELHKGPSQKAVVS